MCHELEKTDFLDWADESLQLAKTAAYRKDGTPDSDFLDAAPLPDGLKQEKLVEALKGLEAPSLSPDYQKNAENIAKRRIVLAGYRLADQLKAVLRKE